jgi:hypothetical protein
MPSLVRLSSSILAVSNSSMRPRAADPAACAAGPPKTVNLS